MEPRIQYAQTADGVSIAFSVLGEGAPLVCMTNIIWSHTQLEWRFPEMRRWYEQLAERRKLLRFDPRGTGLSQRTVDEYSLEALELDLQAVVERHGLARFALFAGINTGPVAIAYAAHHPKQVSHLILWCTWARTSDVKGSRSESFEALQPLMSQDWETYTETRAHVGFGWSEGEPAHRYAAFLRECIAPEMAWTAYRAIDEFDVTSLLAQITSPTLVLHRRQLWLDVEVSRSLAARIPNARLALLEGTADGPYLGDADSVLAAIDEFLGEGEKAAPQAPEAGAFRTILFTDVESSTALIQRLGDARAREVLRAHERIVRDALRAHAGSEVKTMGDGFMASFSSATGALECAVAMQRAFADYNAQVGAQSAAGRTPLQIRIGLNAGEPIAEEEDLFGTAVNLAARIAAKAEGGEILASDVVRQLVAGKGFLFSDRGETVLRGFEDPVRLYEVRWRE